MNEQLAEPIATAATTVAPVLKVTPPIVVAGFTVGGVNLQDWVLYLTIMYTILMIAHKIWSMGIDFNWWSKSKKRKGGK
jgi:hypothetical protein